MDRAYQGASYFMEGYNCAQAVIMAFSDLIGMDQKTCAKLSSSFGGGIGRNSAQVRAKSLEGLSCFGVELDEEKNRNAKGGDDLSKNGSAVRIYVVDTNEEIIVARKAQKLLESK